ncbi:MAG: hypothetical protein ACRDKA_04480 [Actinomycetota bacterium]
MIDQRERFERAFEHFDMPEPAMARLVAHRHRKERNRRIGTAVVAFAVAAAAFGGLARAFLSGPGPRPADQPTGPFMGTWVSTDQDGSSQTMTIRASGEGAYEIVVHDDSASVCSGAPSTMTGTGRLDSATELFVPSPVLACDDGSEPAAVSGPALQEQLRNLTFAHDPAADTLTDSFGVVWSRAGAEEPTPLPTAAEPSPIEGVEEPPVDPAVGELVLHLRGDAEVAIYADGRVIWEIGDGDPGYLQMRLTPEGVELLRSRAVSTGLFERDQGLTLDDGPGFMEVRGGDRSVIVVWGEDTSIVESWPSALLPRQLATISAATAGQAREVIELEAFFRDPTAWGLPRRMYAEPESSPFVPSRLLVTWDAGTPDWSTLPSPAREIVSGNLDTLTRDGCQVISTDQARTIARALAQAGIDTDYNIQRGMLSFWVRPPDDSFVHSFPALPHEVACETRWPGEYSGSD